MCTIFHIAPTRLEAIVSPSSGSFLALNKLISHPDWSLLQCLGLVQVNINHKKTCLLAFLLQFSKYSILWLKINLPK
jgi:hypothetical protein